MATFNNNLGQTAPTKHIEDFRQMLRTSAESFAEKTLYIYKENGETLSVSYSEFNNNVRALTTAMKLHGLSDKAVAIMGDTHPAWTASFYATMIGGGTVVPLDRELDPKQASEFMKIAKCSAIVLTAGVKDKILERMHKLGDIQCFITIGCEIDDERAVKYEDLLAEGYAAVEAGDTFYDEVEINLEQVSAILFTSGTTGTSKGVMLSQGNFVASANASCKSTQYGAKDTLVSVLPIHHTYELTTGQIAAINQGCTVHICEGIRYATRTFKEAKPTALVLVPLFLETVHKKIWAEIKRKGIEKKVRAAMAISDKLLLVGIDNREKMFGEITSAFGGNLRSIVVGGAPIDPQILRDFYSFGITVYQGYGITECSPLVSVNRPGKIKFESVGQPVDGVEVKIAPLDEGGSTDEGEILVKGDNVMHGYYENEEATNAVFTEDGWFRTGDIGKMDKKGYITITGRLKNVIIASNGKNVFPEELEERLNRLSAVRECVVVGREGENGEVVITAVVVPDYDVLGDASDTAANLIIKEAIAQINRSLPAYKHINRFEIRHEDFEKTLTKKIKRFLVK